MIRSSEALTVRLLYQIDNQLWQSDPAPGISSPFRIYYCWRLRTYLYPLTYTPMLTKKTPKSKENLPSKGSIRNYLEKKPLVPIIILLYKISTCSIKWNSVLNLKSYCAIRKDKRKATKSKRYWISWFRKSWARSHQTLNMPTATNLP